MKARLLFVLVLMVLLTVSLSMALAAQGAKAAKGNATQGKTVFEQTCATCHGKDGSGNTPMGKTMKAGDLRSEAVQKQTDDELFKTTASGKGKMVAYEKTVGAAKIHDVIAYLRTLKK